MGVKQSFGTQKGRHGEPVEVFRQFAWHLASSLTLAQAARAGSGQPVAKPRPAKTSGKR